VDGDLTALILGAAEEGGTVDLAYALVTQGPGDQIIPSVLLDDWGNEIRDLQLYDWIRENGLQFPRAEVFGRSPAGDQVQYFLRDLELFAQYPVYAYPGGSERAQGVPLHAVLVEDASADTPQPIHPPDEVIGPLREGQVSWWRVGPQQRELGFIE
jgi:hypothetical protein